MAMVVFFFFFFFSSYFFSVSVIITVTANGKRIFPRPNDGGVSCRKLFTQIALQCRSVREESRLKYDNKSQLKEAARERGTGERQRKRNRERDRRADLKSSPTQRLQLHNSLKSNRAENQTELASKSTSEEPKCECVPGVCVWAVIYLYTLAQHTLVCAAKKLCSIFTQKSQICTRIHAGPSTHTH